MQAATVWGWDGKFEDVKANSEKYISKRWNETIKDCRIEIVARERTEDICYYIAAYTRDSKNVGALAEGLFYVALDEGDTKVDFITIQLFDSIFSDKEVYRKSIKEVEDELKEREQAIANRFGKDSKVNSIAKGRKVMFIFPINLLCELESRCADKITIEIIHENFSLIKNLVDSLSNRMFKRGLVERVIGYKLGRSVNDLKVRNIEVQRDMVIVWLT